jgi:phosphate transport system protein
MARSMLDAQLQEINDQMLHLGQLVEQGLENVLLACERGDVTRCQAVIAADERVDRLRNDIHKYAMRLITLQQPLGARDLRFLTAVFSIVSDLERMGDCATGIARLQLQILPLYSQEKWREQEIQQEAAPSDATARLAVSEETARTSVHQLGYRARIFLQTTMQAFADRDTAAARATIEEDDALDVRYRVVRYDMMSMLVGLRAVASLQQDIYSLQRITYMIWIAHKLERIGDHCVNICERVIYIVEGSSSSSSPARENR